MKKTILILGIIIIIILGLGLWYLDHKWKTELSDFAKMNGYSPTGVPGGMTKDEAIVIAKRDCLEKGESLGSGYYLPKSKTWWFDANLKGRSDVCNNPACVVSEEAKTAEINWRCAGFNG